MKSRIFLAAIFAVSPLVSMANAQSEPAAPAPPGGWPKPLVITYNHDRDVPMPYMVGGSDLVFTDWDFDGDLDLVCSASGKDMVLRRNIGTRTQPRFANTFKEEPHIISDARIGRFFAMPHKLGLPAVDQNRRPSLIAFTRHAAISDIGKKPLGLNLFVPKDDSLTPQWDVIPAMNVDGSPVAEFSDVWMSPAVDCIDWNGDGKEDLVVGVYHPSIAQPNGKYTYGFNHPDSSWVGEAGRLYVMINASRDGKLIFEKPQRVDAVDGSPITGYGAIFARCRDMDGDGKFDLVINTHRPGIAWYRNIGDATSPRFEKAGYISDENDQPIKSALVLRAFFGDLDGDGTPEMLGTSYFAFSMGLLRFDHVSGAKNLATGWKQGDYLPMAGSADTPVSGQGICSPEVVDWNGDGVRDLLIGSEPGTPMVVINRGTNTKPVWDVPTRIKFVDGKPVEFYAIEVGRGSVWGPIEHYLETVQPRLADWDGDGTLDILTGAMGARTLFLRGHVIASELRFDPPVRFMQADGSEHDVAHRIQVDAVDWDGDGKLDLVDCDTQNVVNLYKGDGTTKLGPPQPFLGPDGKPMQLNPSIMGATSGRRCLKIVDWDLDGTRDLISYNAFGPTVNGGHVRLYRGVPDKPMQFEAAVNLFPIVSHHQGGVTLTDWDEDGLLDIVVGGDHGHMSPDAKPMGQFFVFFGKDLPVKPAKRPSAQMAVPNAIGTVK
jgi:hypothetical protein